MSDQARQNMLMRLEGSGGRSTTVTLPQAVLEERTPAERSKELQTMMEKVRTEVHRIEPVKLLDKLAEIVAGKGIGSLVFAADSILGKNIQQKWSETKGLKLIPYENSIEEFKEELFAVDAGITSTFAGIAETGTLVLWPDQHEPRLMSLVPPIHIAILDEKRIFHNFREMLVKEKWNQEMPTNVLLISGPSKTGDIEFSLQYGVHGPKELVVLILEEQ
ncbi:MAG: lactate utilization protein [SAR324 cluster bacterium]|nr:lactate utilization protein [SAR324 cluster bacterium]